MGRNRKISRRSLVPVSVEARASYVDSICVILPERMPKDAFRKLRLSLYAEQRPLKRRYVLRRVPTANDFWIFKLTVHQPTPTSVQILGEAVEAIRARLLEVHLSLDLITRSPNDAITLQDYLEGRLLPSTRLKHPISKFKGTTYFNRKTRKGVEVALYSDKPSKVSGQPCFHMDWRVIGTVALKRAGLATVSAILDLEHKIFWNERLALWLPPSITMLTNARLRQDKSKKPEAINNPLNQSQARLLLRDASSPRGVVIAHEVLSRLRKAESEYNHRPMRLFVQEPHDWMLPASSNALWS